MKFEEGPAFGALIIGAGVSYFVWQKTQNILYGAAAGLGVAAVDYFLLIWIKRFTKK